MRRTESRLHPFRPATGGAAGQQAAGRGPSRRAALLALAVMAVAGLPGCDSVRNTFGLSKQPPDEFTVMTRAPLTLPPDFQLRPPEPGAPRPQELQPDEQARAALFGDPGREPGESYSTADLMAVSPAERALLQVADAEQVDPSIRRIVNEETTALIERDRRFIDRLIFWQKEQPPGEVVDPVRERERLQETAARGVPPTHGTTPTIERRERGILEGIF